MQSLWIKRSSSTINILLFAVALSLLLRFFWVPNFCITLYYTQTCPNNHHYKTTTCLSPPMLSPPKQIPIKSLLYKMTTCLTKPATNFFVPQMNKNNCLKQLLQNFIQRRNVKQCIKNMPFWLYLLYCYFIIQSLFNVYRKCTFMSSQLS